MKRQRKNLFGILGLFAVAAITAYASCLPTPEANAQTTNGTTTITVKVINKAYPAANIATPKDQEIITDPKFDLEYTFTDAEYYILKITNNRTGETETKRIEPEEKDGDGKEPIDLDNYGELGDDFTITITAYAQDSFGEDSITIFYREPEPEIEVPNTGGFAGTLNISKTDYMITGLIAFFVLSGGLLIFLKKSKNRQ